MVHNIATTHGMDNIPSVGIFLRKVAFLMALRLEFIKPYNGKKEAVVTPSVVADVRNRWVTKDYKSQEQQSFIENIMRIHYAPEDIYCLHRYEHVGTFNMGKANGYTMKCTFCDHSYPTDYLSTNNRGK